MVTMEATRAYADLDDLPFEAAGIFDLRAEFADLIVKLSEIARERGCILAFSAAPHTPRFFKGSPDSFRDLLWALFDHGIATPNVEIVMIRISTLGKDLAGQHRLEVTVDANGNCMPPRQLSLFAMKPLAFEGGSPRLAEDNQALCRLAPLIRRLGGNLHVEQVHGWGPRYVARFQLAGIDDDLTQQTDIARKPSQIKLTPFSLPQG